MNVYNALHSINTSIKVGVQYTYFAYDNSDMQDLSDTHIASTLYFFKHLIDLIS